MRGGGPVLPLKGGRREEIFDGAPHGRLQRREESYWRGSHLLVAAACAACCLAFGVTADVHSAPGADPAPERLLGGSPSTNATDDHNSTGSHGAHEHVSGAVNPSVFFLVTFFASALAQWISGMAPHEFRLPHSVLLYFIGTFMAWAAFSLSEHSEFGAAVRAFASVDPHVVFWVFLPALLFEDSSGTAWPVIQRALPSALLLALPGVILNTVLTGAFIRYCMNDWSWWMALLLGSILSATDPVAVVGALTALRAPAKLSHLISGESLFNDGSAVALFQIFLNVAGGKSEFNLGNALGTLCRLALGGPAFGLAVAVVASLWLKKARKLNTQVLIIICGVYGCFFVGEHNFEVSGVLAVVLFGLYISAVGRFSLNVGVEHEFHSIIGFLALISHESIFVIAGVIGYKFLHDQTGTITWRDAGDLFLLYVAIHVTRTLVIVLFWPLLSRMGYGLTPQEAVICVFGGLRGAVGLAMASLAAGQWQLGDTADSKKIGFHTAGIVVLTLAVNGTTITPLYKWLQVDKNKGGRHHMKFLKAALKGADEATREVIDEYKNHWFFHNCDFNIIESLVPKLMSLVQHDELDFYGKMRLVHQEKKHVDKVVTDLAAEFAKRMNNDPSSLRAHCDGKFDKSIDTHHAATEKVRSRFQVSRSFGHLKQGASELEEEELTSEVYQTVANATKVEYEEAYEEGRLPLAAYRILSRSVQYQEEAIWGELGLPKYGVPYPDFLDRESCEINKLKDEPRMEQMKQSFMVGWHYLLDTLPRHRHWHERTLRRLLSSQTISLDWALMARNVITLLEYVTTCEHIREDTSVFDEFAGMLQEPLQKVTKQALEAGLDGIMKEDCGMFIILEHCLCAWKILIEMRQIIQHQQKEGTLASEDAERIEKEVIRPSEKVLVKFIPKKEHLKPLNSSFTARVNPWLDRILLDLLFE